MRPSLGIHLLHRTLLAGNLADNRQPKKAHTDRLHAGSGSKWQHIRTHTTTGLQIHPPFDFSLLNCTILAVNLAHNTSEHTHNDWGFNTSVTLGFFVAPCKTSNSQIEVSTFLCAKAFVLGD